MSFFSRAATAVKSAYNSVKNAFTGNTGQTASAANASRSSGAGSGMSFSGGGSLPAGTKFGTNPAVNVQNAYKSGGLTTQGVSPSLSNIFASANPSISTPTSYSSGSKAPSSYNSPAYSVDYGSGADATAFFQAPYSQTVNADSISSSSQLVLPSTPTTKNHEAFVKGKNVSLGADKTGYFPKIETTAAEASVPTSTEKNLKDYLASVESPVDRVDAYEKAQRESGIQQARLQMQNTQNQINGITTEMNTNLLRLRDTAGREGVTEAVYGGQQAQVTREATIRLLPLQAQLASDQGNLEMAESNLDQLYKIYSEDAENGVNYRNAQRKAIYDFTTGEEKKRLEAQDKKDNFELGLIKDQVNFQQSVAAQALKDGNTRLYNALTSVRPPTNVGASDYEVEKQRYSQRVQEAVSKYSITSSTGKYTTTQDKTIDQINTSVANSLTYKAVSNAKAFTDGVLTSLSRRDGLSDISAINQFQKVIDEGAVTREQDVKLVQGAQSLVGTLRTKIKKLEKGDVLGEDQRTKMRELVTQLYEAKVRSLTDDPYVKSQIIKAEREGVATSDTILGQLGTFGTGGGSQVLTGPDGKKYNVPIDKVDAFLKAGGTR